VIRGNSISAVYVVSVIGLVIVFVGMLQCIMVIFSIIWISVDLRLVGVVIGGNRDIGGNNWSLNGSVA